MLIFGPLSPDAAFLLTVAGGFLIEWELIRPGGILPGVGGLLLVAGGFYSLAGLLPLAAWLLLGSASLAFLAQAVWNRPPVAGIAGSFLLAGAFCVRSGDARPVDSWLAVPLALTFGASVAWLLAMARRARLLKDCTQAF